MSKPKMPHPMHDDHLCYLVNMGYLESNMKDYRDRVKDAAFVCKRCGRTANSADSLCRPVKL